MKDLRDFFGGRHLHHRFRSMGEPERFVVRVDVERFMVGKNGLRSEISSRRFRIGPSTSRYMFCSSSKPLMIAKAHWFRGWAIHSR